MWYYNGKRNNNNIHSSSSNSSSSSSSSSSRLSLHRKWLSFRVLEGRSRARQEEEQEPYRPLPVYHRPAAHAALGCTVACGIVLCGLNDAPFAGSVHLRGIVQAAFCVVAASMYCVYMLMSYVLSIVLSCAEERSGGSVHGSVLLRRTRSSQGRGQEDGCEEEEEAFALDDDDEEEEEEGDDDNRTNTDKDNGGGAYYGVKRHPADLDWLAEEDTSTTTSSIKESEVPDHAAAAAAAAATSAGVGESEEEGAAAQGSGSRRRIRFDPFCNDATTVTSTPSSSSVVAPLLRRAVIMSSTTPSIIGRRGGGRGRASVCYRLRTGGGGGGGTSNNNNNSRSGGFGRMSVMRFVGLPREVVVSSMYLGGTGTFLAVAPLCMWDCAVTLAFLVSLFFIALLDTPRTATIIHRSRAYWMLAVTLSLTMAFAIAIEASSRLPQLASSALMADYVRLHPLFFATALITEGDQKNSAGLFSSLPPSSAALSSNGSLSSSSSSSAGALLTAPPQQLLPDADTEAALLLAQAGHPSLWPFLILAASSPILLRAGGGGVYVGGLYHSMTPSQTLETGLPVNGLLAGLVLSWFSPLESALAHTQNLVRHGYFVAMLVLAPAALAATLALLLHALRRRTALISVAVLLFALMIRQQTLHRALGQHNALDVWGLFCATLSLLLAAWLVCCSSSFAVHHPHEQTPCAPFSSSSSSSSKKAKTGNHRHVDDDDDDAHGNDDAAGVVTNV